MNKDEGDPGKGVRKSPPASDSHPAAPPVKTPAASAAPAPAPGHPSPANARPQAASAPLALNTMALLDSSDDDDDADDDAVLLAAMDAFSEGQASSKAATPRFDRVPQGTPAHQLTTPTTSATGFPKDDCDTDSPLVAAQRRRGRNALAADDLASPLSATARRQAARHAERGVAAVSTFKRPVRVPSSGSSDADSPLTAGRAKRHKQDATKRAPALAEDSSPSVASSASGALQAKRLRRRPLKRAGPAAPPSLAAGGARPHDAGLPGNLELFDTEAIEASGDEDEDDFVAPGRRHRQAHRRAAAQDEEEDEEEEDFIGDDYDLDDSFINDSEDANATQSNTQETEASEGPARREKDMHMYRQSVFMSPDKNPLFSRPSSMHVGNAKFKLAFNRRTPTPSPEAPRYRPGEDLGNVYSPRTKGDEEYFEQLARKEEQRQQRAAAQAALAASAAASAAAPAAATAAAAASPTPAAAPPSQGAAPQAGARRRQLSPPSFALPSAEEDGMEDADWELALAAAEAAEAEEAQASRRKSLSRKKKALNAPGKPRPAAGDAAHDVAAGTAASANGDGGGGGGERSTKPKGRFAAATLIDSSDDDNDFEVAVTERVKRRAEAKLVQQGREAAGAVKEKRGRRKDALLPQTPEHSSGGATSPPRTQPVSAVNCAVLVGTGELKTGGEIVSRLRNVHQLHVNVMPTKGISFVMSHRVAALRLRYSDIPGWHKNTDLADRIRNLRADYGRPYIIIEEDSKVRGSYKVRGAQGRTITVVAPCSSSRASCCLPNSLPWS